MISPGRIWVRRDGSLVDIGAVSAAELHHTLDLLTPRVRDAAGIAFLDRIRDELASREAACR